MQAHYQLTDAQFELQFATGTLHDIPFTHEAHLRLAWIHLHKYGEERAIEQVCNQLKRYVKVAGAEDKYHHTLTVAAIKTVHHFMQKATSTTFKGLVEEFPRLNNNFKELLNSHYGFNIFASERAKKEFVAPDLMPYT